MDAHGREYLAAADGMADLYGRDPAPEADGLDDCYGRYVRVGSWLTWREESWPAGRSMSGLVRAIDAGRYVIDDEGDRHYVTPSQVMPF